MHVAGIDAHTTYVVVAIVGNDGALVGKPVRISNSEPGRLLEVLEPHRPLDVVVEPSPSWPWLYDLLEGEGCQFVLAHPKKLRAIQAVMIQRRRAPDSWLSQYYDRLKERMDWRVARVATARKLARAVHAMLRTGEVWRNA